MVFPFFSWIKFGVGPLTVNVWGLMVALGVLVAFLIARHEARRRGLKGSLIEDVAFWVVLGGVLGARVFFVANEFYLFRDDLLSVFYVWHGGLAWFGGLMGGAIGLTVALRHRRKQLLPIADVLAFSLPAGIFFGRLGCFFIHDHLGKTTNCPVCGAVVTDLGPVRFDLGLYLSLNGALLFLVFLWLRHLKPQRFEGAYLSLYMMWTGASRFVLDFLRTTIQDSPLTGDPHWLGLTPSQYFSVVLFAAGIIVWNRLKTLKSSVG